MSRHIGIVVYGMDRPITGIGRYTLELVRALSNLAPRPQVTLLCAGGPGPLTETKSFQRILLPYSRLLPLLMTSGQIAIRQKAEDLDLDVVHDPTGAMLLTLTGGARVLTIHDVIPYVYPETSTRLDWLIYHMWLPRTARKADAIITDSGPSREDIVTHLSVPPERVEVVPLAADRRFRPMKTAEVEPVLQEYGVERPYILYVGALESRKNLPRLLEAYALLRQWSELWKLVIVGARKWKSSPIFDTVQRLALEPHVYFTGYVKDEHLPAIYAGADLFAFPSLYEGFGLPILESMACGTPVVTSNSSSLPEVAGDVAILVDPYNVEEIAEAMRRVLEDGDLAQELRKGGLERAAQFTWERTARETVAVYEKVIRDRG